MLPKTGNILRREFVIRKQPSRTYRLKDGRLQGCVDGREAVQQAIYCILNTERFDWLIYNWNYGVEPVSYTHLDVYKRQGQRHGTALYDRSCTVKEE